MYVDSFKNLQSFPQIQDLQDDLKFMDLYKPS
jgi:hypothetical protein